MIKQIALLIYSMPILTIPFINTSCSHILPDNVNLDYLGDDVDRYTPQGNIIDNAHPSTHG
jgi:hypothetical protein